MPVCGHVGHRGLRGRTLRRGADALLPAASAGRVIAPQVQDRVRGLHRGSRVRVDQRHRLARPHRGRPPRLPRDRRRRHVDHAGQRLPPLRVPARRGDAERGGGRAAGVPPPRRLRAPPAQPAEVHGEDAGLGHVQGEVRGVPGRVQGRRRRAARARRGRAPARDGPGLGAPDRAVDTGRGCCVSHAGHRSRHRAGNGEAEDRARCLRALAAHQRGAAEADRLSPRDRAPAAGRHHGGPAARAGGSGRGVRRRRDAARRCSRTSCSDGCPPSTSSRSTSG